MKRKALIVLLINSLFTSCASQSERIETKIMDCTYQAFEDNGEAFKAAVVDYENLLIEEKILVDSSGKSYVRALRNIADVKKSNKIPSKFFAAELQNIEKPDQEKVRKCQEIINKDSASYNISKLKGLERVMINAQKSKDLKASSLMNDVLNVLKEEDFEHDFYKIRIFVLLSMIGDSPLMENQPAEIRDKEKEVDLTNALRITIDDKNQIFINDQKVAVKDLGKRIKSYGEKNKSKSVISIKVDKKAMYRKYIEVQEVIDREIQNLRDKLARDKYGVGLNELTPQQLVEIKKLYPLTIVY
ncbi:ExbD/TolR family protein [Flavobacteriaceae bacterium M23B6Z8]